MQKLTDLTKLGETDLEYQKYHEFYETKDGFIVSINIHRPRIHNVIYRADEVDGKYVSSDYYASNKDQLKALFMNDNLREFHDYEAYLNRCPDMKLWITKSPQYLCKSVARAITCDNENEIARYERELTKEELQFVFERENYWKEKFKKRLETYWKKYSDKVYINTYWENR